jgi:hypothetical protein
MEANLGSDSSVVQFEDVEIANVGMFSARSSGAGVREVNELAKELHDRGWDAVTKADFAARTIHDLVAQVDGHPLRQQTYYSQLHFYARKCVH